MKNIKFNKNNLLDHFEELLDMVKNYLFLMINSNELIAGRKL